MCPTALDDALGTAEPGAEFRSLPAAAAWRSPAFLLGDHPGRLANSLAIQFFREVLIPWHEYQPEMDLTRALSNVKRIRSY